jgi:GntR family transcriptional regulator, transcriptional repressor for pyruvate dehydrogenase complex
MLSDRSKSIVEPHSKTNDIVVPRAPGRDTAVLDALAHFVASSGIVPGDRLPTERGLAERLCVGRSTVREALKRWQGLGIVERPQGSGTYLCRAVTPNAVHLSQTMIARDFANLTHLLEIRRALEVEAAGICASRAAPHQAVELSAKLEAFERLFHRHDQNSAEVDWAFHLSIIRATENPFFEQIISGIHQALYRLWECPFGIADFSHSSFPFHRSMFNTIRRGEPDKTRAECVKIIACTEADLKRDAAGFGIGVDK